MSKKLTLREEKTISAVVAYLSRAEKIDSQINLLLLDKEKMRASLYGRSPGGEGSSRSPASDSLGRAVIKVMRYEERIDQRIDDLVDTREQIGKIIDFLEDPVEHEVMKRKYLFFQKVRSKYDKQRSKYITGIADSMHYSVANVYKIHDRAALRLASMLDFDVLGKE
jgi:hypothetical protein